MGNLPHEISMTILNKYFIKDIPVLREIKEYAESKYGKFGVNIGF
jgi:hypothetical protein